jgi:hypothetical protein
VRAPCASAASHAFPRCPGKYSLFARVHLIAPPQLENGPGGEVVIESPLLDVKIAETQDPELVRYAGDAARNLLFQQKPLITASSTLNEWWETKRLCDGVLARGWASSDQEPKPRLTIELEKPTRANLLQLVTAVISPDRPARITKVNVTINGKGPPLELAIDPSPVRKSKLRFPQVLVVRRIDLEVTEVSGDVAPLKSVGFARSSCRWRGRRRGEGAVHSSTTRAGARRRRPRSRGDGARAGRRAACTRCTRERPARRAARTSRARRSRPRASSRARRTSVRSA